MAAANSDGDREWRQAVYLDMTDYSQHCPSAWTTISTQLQSELVDINPPVALAVALSSTVHMECHTHESADAIQMISKFITKCIPGGSTSLEGWYVDGVSLMHAPLRLPPLPGSTPLTIPRRIARCNLASHSIVKSCHTEVVVVLCDSSRNSLTTCEGKSNCVNE